MSNNSIRMVTILGPIGDDSIRMSQIPKLGDGINCVFLIDKRDKLAPMSPQNNNKKQQAISPLQLKFLIGDNSIRMSQIPKLENCVYS